MDMAQATYRFINFGYLRHCVGYKTDNELTAFFAIDFGSMNFNHAAQIQDILWEFLREQCLYQGITCSKITWKLASMELIACSIAP